MEENITPLEPARLQGLFKRLKTEKENGVFATVAQIQATAVRRAGDGSIKFKEDIGPILKEILLVKYAGFILDFDMIIRTIIPLILTSLGISQDNKSKAALKKEIDNREADIFIELSPILELNDQHLVGKKIEAFQEHYFFRATSKGIFIHDIDRINTPVNTASFAKQHISPQMYDDRHKLISFGQFVVDNNRLREFEDIVCDPRKPLLVTKFNPELGRTVYDINVWKGWSYENTPPLENPEEHCKCILKHIKEILANNDEKEYHYILNYLATWVQSPWIIPGIALFFYGHEGCGKDIIIQALQKIIHPDHITSISDNVFKSDSNWPLGRKFIHVREFSKISNVKTTSYLNDILESNMIRYRIMFNDPILVENPGFYWISSNIEDAIPAREDTRRWKIFHCSDKYRFRNNATPGYQETRLNYLRKLGEEIENSGPQALYQILKEYPIQDIKELSINSIGLQEMREENQSPLDVFIEDFMSQLRVPNYNDMMMPGMEMAYPVLSEKEDTKVETSIIRKSYGVLWNKSGKRGPAPESRKFSRLFLIGLGLPWEEGEEYTNRRKHLKSTNGVLYYIFPPVAELQRIFRKKPME